MVAASGEQCPTCGSHMAADQRYCLSCGLRRGDPRLPFMDAVVFMDAVNRPRDATAAPPPPPSERGPRMSANASLIAGIATLVLAIGVGVLIGRSGNSGTPSAATPAPQVIKVGGGGGEISPSTPQEGATGGGNAGKAKPGNANEAQGKSETGASGASKASEEILKPKVPQAKPEAQVGEKCEKGTAGCGKSGKFEGNFFGE
jgi:hypothetical protein